MPWWWFTVEQELLLPAIPDLAELAAPHAVEIEEEGRNVVLVAHEERHAHAPTVGDLNVPRKGRALA
jgi:hypothetical protein